MMLRFEIHERGREPLPALDIDDDVVVIGSGPSAQVQLPAAAATAAHVRIAGGSWTLLAESRIGGMLRAAGDSGSVGHGIVLEIGDYRVRVSTAPSGIGLAHDSTESFASELPTPRPGEPPDGATGLAGADRRWPIFALAAIAAFALAGLIWILAS